MRRFILTSHKMKGQIEVLYGHDGRLLRLDFGGVHIESDQSIAWIKHYVSVQADSIDTCFPSKDMIIREAEFEVTFEEFWRNYPYHRNRHLAEKEWNKMTTAEQYRAFVATIHYAGYCKRNIKWYKPKLADKWLKDKEYLNDFQKL